LDIVRVWFGYGSGRTLLGYCSGHTLLWSIIRDARCSSLTPTCYGSHVIVISSHPTYGHSARRVIRFETHILRGSNQPRWLTRERDQVPHDLWAFVEQSTFLWRSALLAVLNCSSPTYGKFGSRPQELCDIAHLMCAQTYSLRKLAFACVPKEKRKKQKRVRFNFRPDHDVTTITI
jgi:hypothetical protein